MAFAEDLVNPGFVKPALKSPGLDFSADCNMQEYAI